MQGNPNFQEKIVSAFGNLIFRVINKPNGTINEQGQCKFCLIAEDSSKCIYQGSEIAAFYDAYPSSRCHILVIPRRHIRNIYDLQQTDKELVERMYQKGQELMKELGYTNVKYGYHIPPMNSVEHLHMHCLALPYNNFFKKVVYSATFMLAETLLGKF